MYCNLIGREGFKVWVGKRSGFLYLLVRAILQVGEKND